MCERNPPHSRPEAGEDDLTDVAVLAALSGCLRVPAAAQAIRSLVPAGTTACCAMRVA